MVCEKHPDKKFPHDECVGPGVPNVTAAYEEGKREAIMEESVKRYEQAKEDGTLDKHFPVLSFRKDT